MTKKSSKKSEITSASNNQIFNGIVDFFSIIKSKIVPNDDFKFLKNKIKEKEKQDKQRISELIKYEKYKLKLEEKRKKRIGKKVNRIVREKEKTTLKRMLIREKDKLKHDKQSIKNKKNTRKFLKNVNYQLSQITLAFLATVKTFFQKKSTKVTLAKFETNIPENEIIVNEVPPESIEIKETKTRIVKSTKILQENLDQMKIDTILEQLKLIKRYIKSKKTKLAKEEYKKVSEIYSTLEEDKKIQIWQKIQPIYDKLLKHHHKKKKKK